MDISKRHNTHHRDQHADIAYRYIYPTAWGRNETHETWAPRGNDSLK